MRDAEINMNRPASYLNILSFFLYIPGTNVLLYYREWYVVPRIIFLLDAFYLSRICVSNMLFNIWFLDEFWKLPKESSKYA